MVSFGLCLKMNEQLTRIPGKTSTRRRNPWVRFSRSQRSGWGFIAFVIGLILHFALSSNASINNVVRPSVVKMESWSHVHVNAYDARWRILELCSLLFCLHEVVGRFRLAGSDLQGVWNHTRSSALYDAHRYDDKHSQVHMQVSCWTWIFISFARRKP